MVCGVVYFSGSFFLVWFCVCGGGFQGMGFSEEQVFLASARREVWAILVFCRALFLVATVLFLGGSGLLRFGWIFLHGGYLLGKVSEPF